MDSNELRQKFLQFFKEKGHTVVPSASLVPENDPTVLFTTAGMQQLVPFLLGEKHPVGDKLVNIQGCIRTGDIKEVGDKAHLTFFEMLGYWSLGSYWKKEAIELIFEFLTKELNIKIENLAITCFQGDESNNISKDIESAEIWKSLGILEERIAYLGYNDNFWGPVGKTGPCGPDTEIFVWTDRENIPIRYDAADKRWVEIGNSVFIQYDKKSDGKYKLLKQKNVDFGGGYERILAYLEGKDNVFETELFEPIIANLEKYLPLKRDIDGEYLRIIADHLKASIMIINNGIIPSNKERGYVVRRLLRRALLHSQWESMDTTWVKNVVNIIISIYKDYYPELENNKAKINEVILLEIIKFQKTLKLGKKEIEKLKILNGKEAFDLYQTYGFPLELSKEYAALKKIKIDESDFYEEMKKHQELSRTASAGMFKGGLVDNSEITTKYHTATHLLLASLRQVLGQGVTQKGANINAERIRFDFSYPEKMIDEQIKQVEDLVNEKIQADLPVEMQEMNLAEAKNSGATGVFESKYGDKVKVYSIGPSTGSGFTVSREICGGPHVDRTGKLGHFKIIKEESSSAGVRRIKAVLE